MSSIFVPTAQIKNPDLDQIQRILLRYTCLIHPLVRSPTNLREVAAVQISVAPVGCTPRTASSSDLDPRKKSRKSKQTSEATALATSRSNCYGRARPANAQRPGWAPPGRHDRLSLCPCFPHSQARSISPPCPSSCIVRWIFRNQSKARPPSDS